MVFAGPFPVLRALRAPLAALCAVLLCWNALVATAVASGTDGPLGTICSALATTDVAITDATDGSGDAGGADGRLHGGCVFCSAAAAALPALDAVPAYRLVHDRTYLAPDRGTCPTASSSVWDGPPPMRGPPASA